MGKGWSMQSNKLRIISHSTIKYSCAILLIKSLFVCFTLLISSGLYAGDDWVNKNPASKPSSRKSHALAYIGNYQVLLFGGNDGTKSDETWLYNINNNSWSQKYPSTKPSGRYDHAMAYIGDDNVILFGGNDGGYPSETWVYDVSDNNWIQKNPSSNPTGRRYHAMAYIGDDRIILFGGSDDQTWLYDLSDDSWTLKTPSSYPSRRRYHDMSYFGSNQVILFGGYNDVTSSEDNETWVYDLIDNNWIQKSPTSIPSARHYHGMAYIGNRSALLFGGYSPSMTFDDTWIFSLTSDNWSQDSNNINPSSRYEHALSETSMDGSSFLVLFGGNSGGDETWSFGGGNYLFNSTSPLAPQNLTATPGNQQITLRWDTNNESDLARYRIYRSTTSPANTLIDSISGSLPDTIYTDLGLTNGQTYYYRITAVDSTDNESGYSSEVSATPQRQLYTVKTDGSGDFTVIQTAIDATTDGDTVLVHPGTYVENINFNGKNIVVGSLFLTTQDTSYISTTIIDGNNNGNSVITFDSGENSMAVLSGFIIQNGSRIHGLTRGGGIYCANSSPTLVNLTITNNTASHGGGIACDYANPLK